MILKKSGITGCQKCISYILRFHNDSLLLRKDLSLNSSIDMQKRNNTADIEQLKFVTANILIFVTVNILKSLS